MVSGRNIILVALLVLIIAGCQQAVDSMNDTLNDSNDTEVDAGVSGPVTVDRGRPPATVNYSVIVTGTEGEVIELEPEALDPDNDTVSFEFSEPLDDDGVWRTDVGDAGDYLVTVKAFDGVDYTSQQVLVRVQRKNRKPTMDCPERITVTETEVIKIDCNIQDPEGDEVVTIYRDFMTTSRYRTTYEDQGRHTVTVTSWDKQNVNETVTQTIEIGVKNLNRPPTVSFDFDREITGKEGDVITVKPDVEDPDNDSIDIEYSEPFGDDGVWRTEIGDAGDYNASVVVSDGENVVRKVFQVHLEERNTAPVIRNLRDVEVDEGDTINLGFEVFDREQDDVDVDITGYMNSRTKTVSYSDARPSACSQKGCTAEYTVTVTATDGRETTQETITVEVTDKNRPPIFRVPA